MIQFFLENYDPIVGSAIAILFLSLCIISWETSDGLDNSL